MKTHFQYHIKKRTNRSIPSIGVLKRTLSITDEEFDSFYTLIANDDAYKKVSGHFKSSGDERLVYNPHPLVRKIQRMINSRIFNPKKPKEGVVIWPKYLYGSVPNTLKWVDGKLEVFHRDYISCAKNHCLTKSILKVDISDFYENIHWQDVYEIFNKVFKYADDVSKALADFCTYDNKVPQGGLTSSFIASAVLHDVEPKLVQRLHKKKLIYTRLVDDITVSSYTKNYDFTLAVGLIKEMLLSKDLPINEEKLVISNHSNSSTLVHGLRVNFKQPRLPEDEVSKIRASVRSLENLAKDSKYRTSRDYRKSHAMCMGRVNRMQSIGHNQAKQLLNRVLKILPLPSYQDIITAHKLVYRLEKNFENDKGTYSYKRIYNLAHYELNLLQRSFSSHAKGLRLRLKEVRPNEV
ncbi:Reverse transcriptase (RNA-dependent DNA polymerase) [Pseudoalteromonas sp. P1-26]|uniref:reverse transcriptase family protein n=1 Tax=Pseudoalteromonas sp. P1-26 TaxID=1723759 RepID=UPI0006D66FCB|nr:reverse transcriptase family protein [Pseudoalteromonas sp. P1-26]KPZ71197.1 Reverse transcriptase (RNA-dependent DNA polymerase) [Pseudoalteromonas sp. P1-26]